MALPIKEQIALLTDLHLKQEVLCEIYSHIGQHISSENLLDCAPRTSPEKKIYSLKNVPSYFRTTLLKP